MNRPVKSPPAALQWQVVTRSKEPITGNLWTLIQRLPPGTLLRPVGIR